MPINEIVRGTMFKSKYMILPYVCIFVGIILSIFYPTAVVALFSWFYLIGLILVFVVRDELFPNRWVVWRVSLNDLIDWQQAERIFRK